MTNKSEDFSLIQVGLVCALLVASAAVFVAPLPIAAVGALAYILIAMRLPLPSLCLIVVSLPFYLLDRHIGRLEFSPTEILIGLATIAAVLRGIRFLMSHGVGKDGSSRALVEPDSGHTPARLVRRSHETDSWWHHFLDVAAVRVGDPGLAAVVILIVLAGAMSLTASVTIRESLRSFRTIIVEPAVFYFLV